jgi:hypothetical protein
MNNNKRYGFNKEKSFPERLGTRKKLKSLTVVTTPIQQKQFLGDEKGELIAWISYSITKGRVAEDTMKYIYENRKTLEVVYTDDASEPILMKNEWTNKSLLTLDDWIW